MSVLLFLGIILVALMFGIGRKKGLLSFIALAMNFLALFIYLILVIKGVPMLVMTICTCLVIAAVNIFFVNTYCHKTIIAFKSVLIVTSIMSIVCLVFNFFARVQGVSYEALDELSMYSLEVGINFNRLISCVMILALMGVTTDSAMAVTSAMAEIKYKNPEITTNELYSSGKYVISEIMGTTISTVFFSFLCTSLNIILYSYDVGYTIGYLLNLKEFVYEVGQFFILSLGAIIILPVTLYLFIRQEKK